MKLGNDPSSQLVLSRLERAVLAALARAVGGDAGALLEAQAGQARVVMRSHSGVAAKMFGALAEAGINIQMISTSEIKTAVTVNEDEIEKAARVVHTAFGLDK